jgi:hypothetical protein
MHSDKIGNSRDPITVTANEACKLSGFGPTTIWKFIKDGRLKVRRVPGVDRTLILYSSLRELLTPDASENTKTPPAEASTRPPAKGCAALEGARPLDQGC